MLPAHGHQPPGVPWPHLAINLVNRLKRSNFINFYQLHRTKDLTPAGISTIRRISNGAFIAFCAFCALFRGSANHLLWNPGDETYSLMKLRRKQISCRRIYTLSSPRFSIYSSPRALSHCLPVCGQGLKSSSCEGTAYGHGWPEFFWGSPKVCLL